MSDDTTTVRIESTDGVSLALHDMGGSGPALIICHATGFHGRAYSPMARALVAHHHVWAIDFRGHGASTPPSTGDFAWSGMAHDLLACIDAIGTSAVLAFGHSLGGAAVLLAETSRPGSIAAAYLYEPIVLPRELVIGRTDNPLGEAARRRREVFGSKAEALMRYASRPPLSVLRSDALAAYVEDGFVELADGTVRLACLPEHEARTFECEEKMTLDRIDGLALPITVGAGMVGGSPNPADFAATIVERLVNGRLVEYEHLGHFGPLESPDQIAAEVLAALPRRGRRGSSPH
jgi:pimeloyl-ACP methyl ester carboxylesterase